MPAICAFAGLPGLHNDRIGEPLGIGGTGEEDSCGIRPRLRNFRALKLAAQILITALWLAGIAAAQNHGAAFAAKALSDFDRVDSEPIPALADAQACVQSSAAAIQAVKPEERYLYLYKKGYCELFAGLASGQSESFHAAAQDFTEANSNWPKKAAVRPPA